MRLQNIIRDFQLKYSHEIVDLQEHQNYINDLYRVERQQAYIWFNDKYDWRRPIYDECNGAELVEVNNIESPMYMKYLLSQIPFVHNETQALNELYPNGFNTTEMTSCCIIAATNDRVDYWNNLVQQMNPNSVWKLQSKDTFGEVDDPHGILANMMTEDVLNQFGNNGIPPHNLELKVGDICIVLRNLSIRDGLQNNARVRITNISNYCIRVQTIERNPKASSLPRILLKFKLPFMHSYELT